MDDPYAVLGLTPDATEGAIKRAFRRLAILYHPDRNPGDAAAAKKFTEASAAYQFLKEHGFRVAVPTPSVEPPPEAEAEVEPERPEFWPDGSKIHYPTQAEIDALINNEPRPRASRTVLATLLWLIFVFVLYIALGGDKSSEGSGGWGPKDYVKQNPRYGF